MHITGRKDQIITLSVAPCVPKGIGVEISKGCSHGCIYCFSACGPSEKSKTVVYFSNVAEVLDQFLATHSQETRNVHLGYVTDFFQDSDDPVAEQIRLDVLDVLLKYDVNISCLTKGFPNDAAIDKINQMAHRFTIMIDCGMDDKTWETNVLPLTVRCEQWKKVKCNIGARIDPLIPTLVEKTDFNAIFALLASIGVKHVDTSFLFLTDEVMDTVEKVVSEEELERLLEHYSLGEEECLNSAVQWTGEQVDMEDIRYKIDVIPLPSPNAEYRRKVISSLQTWGHIHGITVRLCSCKNRSMHGFTGLCTDARRLIELRKLCA